MQTSDEYHGNAHLHANFVFIKKWANMLFDRS